MSVGISVRPTDQWPMHGGVALITGGDQPLGGAIAHTLAETVDTVVVGGDDGDRLDELADSIDAASVGVVRADVRDEFDLERLAETASRHGRIEVVVPAARVHHSPDGRTAVATPYAAVDDELRANLRGVFATIKEVIPHLDETSRVVVPTYDDAASGGTFAVGEQAVAGLVESLAATEDLSIAAVETGVATPDGGDIEAAAKRVSAVAAASSETFDGRTISGPD